MVRLIKLSALLLALMMLLTPTGGVFAKEETGKDKIARDLYKSLRDAGDQAYRRWKELSLEQQTLVLDLLQPDWYKEGKKGELVAIKSDVEQVQVARPIRTQAYYVKNARYCCEVYKRATAVRGSGGSNSQLTLSTTLTVSNSWSGNWQVTARDVSASVGFDVTRSQSYTYSYSITVPPGQTWEIDATNVFSRSMYEVWFYNYSSTWKVEDGWADNFFRVDYLAWRVS